MDLFTAVDNYGYTENGALTYKSTLNANLDLFAMGGALRSRSENDIIDLVDKAYKEDPKTCIAILLYLRDIRGGMGEKRVFRTAISYLINNKVNNKALMDATIEVGSWKDIFEVFPFDIYAPYVKEVYESHVATNLVTLMEKWMPSIGGKHNKTAEKLASYLGLTPKQYRKYLSKSRANLNIVETKLCEKNYASIEYDKLPSRASLIYRNAFYRNDGFRYTEYLRDVASGKKKINTSTLYPYEIIRPIVNRICDYPPFEINETVIDDVDALEATWNNLPPIHNEGNRSIVVADVSGSMRGTPMCIAISLGMMFAAQNKGIFHNKLITFSANPNFITFEDDDDLVQRIFKIARANWDMNTNLQAIFDLILRAAVENNLPEEEMPKTIYLVSDMEFDSCTGGHTNFEDIKDKYKNAGYEMPTIVFWNVNSRQNNVPVRYNENKVALVSGASPNIFNMIINGDINPMKMLIQTISNERYSYLTNLICTA